MPNRLLPTVYWTCPSTCAQTNVLVLIIIVHTNLPLTFSQFVITFVEEVLTNQVTSVKFFPLGGRWRSQIIESAIRKGFTVVRKIAFVLIIGLLFDNKRFVKLPI